MSRYRMCPSPEQEEALLRHCAHARFVWNLGLEQRLEWRPGRGPTPGYLEQCRQLAEARAAEPWLAAGSSNVQQHALRDLEEAWRCVFAGTHRKPGFRKQNVHEGFRIAGPRTGYTAAWGVRRISRHFGEVRVPKIGWVRFRWSRAVPDAAKSYRVTRDRSGRWHLAFAVAPAPVASPNVGTVVGIDRGIAVSAALSTGELLHAPQLSPQRQQRLKLLQRKLARAKRGSKRRGKAKLAIAKLYARETDARKDWCEKVSTDITQRFDVIRVEDLNLKKIVRSARGSVEAPGRNVRQKAGLTRGIVLSGWGRLVRRLEQKAPGRVEKVNPRFTSQRCSACGHVAAESRKSQALFACVACTYTGNADVNAAINIAAGHAVTARGGPKSRPANREPQTAKQSGIPGAARGDANRPIGTYLLPIPSRMLG